MLLSYETCLSGILSHLLVTLFEIDDGLVSL